MRSNTMNLAVAAALAAAVGMATSATAQQTDAKEKCYGVALAGKNDCASTGNNSCAGLSKVDHDKGAWKYVAAGTCTQMEVTLKDGAKRKGSLQPVRG